MLNKVMKLHKNEKGITGLETAIILIAFVVVASVFAYTVLSAGLFSTQKSQEAVYSGLQTAQSTVELKGGVVGKAVTTGASGSIAQLTFTLSTVAGGEAIDFTAPTADAQTGLAMNDDTANNYVIISYVDSTQRVDNLMWSKAFIGSNDSDDLLEDGEKVQITIGAAGGLGDLDDALTENIIVNKTFTIELKTAKGAVLTFQRTTGAWIDAVNTLN
jgi:flagellin FlaB